MRNYYFPIEKWFYVQILILNFNFIFPKYVDLDFPPKKS